MLKRPGLISGRLAQLVERFVYTEDVGGSSPSSPTIPRRNWTAYHLTGKPRAKRSRIEPGSPSMLPPFSGIAAGIRRSGRRDLSANRLAQNIS